MTRKRGYCAAVLLFAAVLVAGSCSSSLVLRRDLDATGRVALVSTVLPRVVDNKREANQQVLQAAADHAAAQVRSGLAAAHTWKVLDATKIGGGKAVLSLGKVSEKDLADLFPQAGEQIKIRDAVLAARTAWNEQFLGAGGLAIVPREALRPDEERALTDPAVRTMMLDQAGRLCTALQVDAVAFAHVRYSITHPRENAFIVTDDRTDGLLSLSATLVVVDKTGKVIVDMGVRSVDERSRSRDLLPLYRGAGKDAVQAANIDLADPKKKVEKAFTALIEEAVADLMDDLKAKL